MSWSKVKQSAEFVIDKKSLGQGGFRVAFKASCSTHLDAFNGKSWVVKKFLPKTLDAVQDLGQTPEEHARRVVQMHCLARYFAQQFAELQQLDLEKVLFLKKSTLVSQILVKS
jgi:hypothetical protein